MNVNIIKICANYKNNVKVTILNVYTGTNA